MKQLQLSARARLGVVLGVSSLASSILYIVGVWGAYERDFTYMNWNLVLAWAALAITLWLEQVLRRNLWSTWYALAVTFLWILFLPNTFYMITDYIHMAEIPTSELVFGAITFSSFIFNAFVLGVLSLAIVHNELLKRLTKRAAALTVGGVLLVCSFAIYIGRELRWNSWDIVTNPSSLLFDVTDRLINIHHHPRILTTTLGFFVLLTTLYAVAWHANMLLRASHRSN